MKRSKAAARNALNRFRYCRIGKAERRLHAKYGWILHEMADFVTRKCYWILKDCEPVPATMLELMDWKETGAAQLFLTTFKGAEVSTVFLVTYPPPYCFETMVFASGFPFDGEAERYPSYSAARDGHAKHVQRVEDFLRGTECKPTT